MTALPDDERTRRSGLWSFPDRQDLGFTMLLGGVGAAMYGLSTVGYPHTVAPLALAAGGAVLAERGWHKWRHLPAETEPEMDMDLGMGMDPMMMGMPNWGGPEGYVPEQVSRILDVVRATWPEDMVPDWDGFEMDGDRLISYALRATNAGYFSDEGVKTRVVNKMKPVLEGNWTPGFDTQTDTFTMTQRSSLPTLLLPAPGTLEHNPWHVVQSEEEARRNYLTFQWTPGVGEDGNYIWFNPREFPHIGIYGTTGGGKSVTVRAILEQFRAAGFQLFLGDGKNLDYGNYKTVPGVAAVASTLEEQVLLVSMVRKIMDQRRAQGNRLATQGVSRQEIENSYQPLLLVLDELSTTVADLKTNYKDYARFKTDLSAILKVGRQLRCAVVLCTQDMRDDTLPSDLRGMLAATMCMGKPDDMIVRKGFPDAAQGEARRKGDTISKKTRGRGIMAVETKDGPVVSLFQSFYSYSPAEDVTDAGLPSTIKSAWEPFKTRVTDAVPQMYSRVWVRPEMPAPPDKGKDPNAEHREFFEKYDRLKIAELSVADMQQFKLIALDSPKTTPEERARFDPLSPVYVGGPPSDTGEDDFLDVGL